ncbi:MAG: 2-iminoacetate synthase ThiH [Deltaproteobacteria bacterium]|nr:2-iminoacetate synthase ThiH [Deltaproteobacteria bacterium]
MNVQQFQNLLKPLTESERLHLFQSARTLTRQRFGRTIQLFAPLYISNECVVTCTYCGFSRQNKIERKTLTVDEVLKEAEYLRQQRFRHLLLVSGEHPKQVSPEYLSLIAQKLRPLFASLAIEVAPFDKETYSRLCASGVDRVVLYQETYDRLQYASVHLAGPKKFYEKRIQSAEAVLQSGIRSLGMGILLGLSDWRAEATALFEHLLGLRKKYWRADYTVSFPRLRPCASDFAIPHPVSDDDFKQLIAAFRLALPEAGIVLSTRESATLRDELIGLGVTQMSAGSRTEPGGYLHPDQALKQFETEDQRSPEEISRAVQAKGLEPVWKDEESTLMEVL